jgi:hypothetical protein
MTPFTAALTVRNRFVVTPAVPVTGSSPWRTV